MILRQLLVVILLFSSVTAMELSKPYIRNQSSENITIRTADDQRVFIPLSLVRYFRTLQNMIDDYSLEMARIQEIPLDFNALSLNTLLELAHLKLHQQDENAFSPMLWKYSILELTHLLVLANYLDCELLRTDILLIVSKKISETELQDHHLCEALDDILPRELQDMIKDLLLMKFQHITNFIRVTHILNDPTATKGRGTLRVLFSPTGRFLKVGEKDTLMRANTENFYLYELGERTIKMIGYFTRDNAGFSPDESYFFVELGERGHSFFRRESGNSQISLMDLRTKEKRTIRVPGGSPVCYFSHDSRVLIVNNVPYDVTTGLPLLGYRTGAERLREEENYTFYRELKARWGDRFYVVGLCCFVNDPKPTFLGYYHPEFWKVKEHVHVLCSQLPRELVDSDIEIKISKNPGHVVMMFWKNSFPPLYRGTSATILSNLFYIFDISNPQAIQQRFYFENVTSHKVSPDEKVLLLAFDTEVCRIDLVTCTISRFPLDRKEYYLFAKSIDCNKVLILYKSGKMCLYSFIATSQEWSMIEIPHQFDLPNPSSGKYNPGVSSTIFAHFDDDIIVTRGQNRFLRSIEIRHVPVRLLMKNCSLKELMMLIASAKNPTLLLDPYHRALYGALHPDVMRVLTQDPARMEPGSASSSQEDRALASGFEKLLSLEPEMAFSDAPADLAVTVNADGSDEEGGSVIEYDSDNSHDETDFQRRSEGAEPPLKKQRKR